jgi:protein-L-isoaspartate(D-aspartate) O-methyltransferase
VADRGRRLGDLSSFLRRLLAMESAETDSDTLDLRRAELVAEIEREALATADYTGRPHFREAVLAAIGRVPRHRFVPPEMEGAAYLDSALGIGHGQTISQPYIVALMTDLLEVSPGDKILEIGGGSGYQAAVLAELGTEVVSVERVEALAESARGRLRELGYERVRMIAGDGYYGCPERGPYDAIIVTAAARSTPPPLLEQLKPGGRLVIPLGLPDLGQDLVLIRKHPDGTLDRRSILPVAFVPFLHPENGQAGTKPAS